MLGLKFFSDDCESKTPAHLSRYLPSVFRAMIGLLRGKKAFWVYNFDNCINRLNQTSLLTFQLSRKLSIYGLSSWQKPAGEGHFKELALRGFPPLRNQYNAGEFKCYHQNTVHPTRKTVCPGLRIWHLNGIKLEQMIKI